MLKSRASWLSTKSKKTCRTGRGPNGGKQLPVGTCPLAALYRRVVRQTRVPSVAPEDHAQATGQVNALPPRRVQSSSSSQQLVSDAGDVDDADETCGSARLKRSVTIFLHCPRAESSKIPPSLAPFHNCSCGSGKEWLPPRGLQGEVAKAVHAGRGLVTAGPRW